MIKTLLANVINIRVNDEVIYCGHFATVKEISDHKNTALVSTPLFPTANVWVPISQLKPVKKYYSS